MKKKKSKATNAPKQPNMEKMLKSWFDAGVDLVKLTTDRLQDNFEEVFDKNELAQKRGKKIEKEFREELEEFRARMDERLEMFNNQLSGAFSFFRKRKSSGKLKQRVKDLESLVNGYLDGFLDKEEEEKTKKKSKKKSSKKKKKATAKKKADKAKKSTKDKKPKKAKKIIIEVKGSEKKEAPKASKKMGAPKAVPQKATVTAKKTATPKKATAKKTEAPKKATAKKTEAPKKATAKKTEAPKKPTTTAKKPAAPKKVVAPRVVKTTAPKVGVKKTTAAAPKATTAQPAAPRRRGRPAGSKNKPKATTAKSTTAKKTTTSTKVVKPAKAKADEPVKRFTVDKSVPIMDRIKSRRKALNFNSFGKGVRGNGDDLTVIKGVGKVLSNKLRALGINTYAQISKMSADDVDIVNEALEYFPGRIAADDWVAQAKALLK